MIEWLFIATHKRIYNHL